MRTNLQLYYFAITNYSTNCLGHGHGYEYHSSEVVAARHLRDADADSAGSDLSDPYCTCHIQGKLKTKVQGFQRYGFHLSANHFVIIR